MKAITDVEFLTDLIKVGEGTIRSLEGRNRDFMAVIAKIDHAISIRSSNEDIIIAICEILERFRADLNTPEIH